MSDKVKGALLATFGGICWGLSGSMGQYLFTYEGMDSRWLVPIRLGLAGIILFIYSLVKYKKMVFKPWKSFSDAWQLVVYGLFGISFCQFTYFLTIQLSNASVGTILQDLSPIFILLVECYLAKRKPHFREVIAIVLALVGVFLITTHGRLDGFSIPFTALMVGVSCAIFVMIYNVVPKKLLRDYPVTLLQGWAFLMGGLFMSIVFRPWSYNYIPSGMGVVGIIFVVIVGNVLAFTSYMKGVSLIGPNSAILYGFSEPLTALIVTLFMGSHLYVGDVIGFLCVFLMLYMISKREE